MAISEAEKNANVSKILMGQKMMEKDRARQKQEIQNQMNMAHAWKEPGRCCFLSVKTTNFFFPSYVYFTRFHESESIILLSLFQGHDRRWSKQVEAYSPVSWAEIYRSHNW